MTVLQMLPGAFALDYPVFVKPIDEPRNNNATLTPDTHLQFVTEPNTTYFIRCGFICWAGTSSGFKWLIGHTGTTTAAMFGVRRVGQPNAPTGFLQSGILEFHMITASIMSTGTLVDTMGASAISTERCFGYFEGILQVGATGGVFSLNWAQVTSSAGFATVFAGSYLHRQKVTSGISIKAATTSRTTNTTPTADPDLQQVLATGTDYVIRMGVMGSAGATPDFQIGLDDGGGTPQYFGGMVNIAENAENLLVLPGVNEQTAKPIGALTGSIVQPMTGSDTANTGNFYDMEAAGRFTGTANPFSLIWAQNTSSGTATTILEDSYLLVRPVDAAHDEFVWKTADESRASDITLTDDDELAVTLEADAVYLITVLGLFQSASATPDFIERLQFTGTTTDFSGILDWQGTSDLNNAVNDSANTFAYTGTGAGYLQNLSNTNTAPPATGAFRYSGILRVGGSGGTLKLQWAQNATSATSVTVLAGSYIHAERKA